MQELDDTTFDSHVMGEAAPVLVFVFADWAGPCHKARPEIEGIAAAYGNSLKVFSLNVEDSPNTAVKYQVRGVPALLLFYEDALVASLVGAVSGEVVSEWLAAKGAI